MTTLRQVKRIHADLVRSQSSALRQCIANLTPCFKWPTESLFQGPARLDGMRSMIDRARCQSSERAPCIVAALAAATGMRSNDAAAMVSHYGAERVLVAMSLPRRDNYRAAYLLAGELPDQWLAQARSLEITNVPGHDDRAPA